MIGKSGANEEYQITGLKTGDGLTDVDQEDQYLLFTLSRFPSKQLLSVSVKTQPLLQ